MAGESLLTLAEVLASLPDNNSNLIQPLDHRNDVIALTNDLGFLEENDPFTIPILDGTFVSINPLLPTPIQVSNFWALDGTNAQFVDYGAITINPGHQRLLNLVCSLFVQKVGGGTASYTFQFFVAGAPVSREIDVADIGPFQQVAFGEEILFDYSLGVAAPVTVRVRGDGTTDGLEVEDFSMKLTGVLI